jgi:hypothetical protein
MPISKTFKGDLIAACRAFAENREAYGPSARMARSANYDQRNTERTAPMNSMPGSSFLETIYGPAARMGAKSDAIPSTGNRANETKPAVSTSLYISDHTAN